MLDYPEVEQVYVLSNSFKQSNISLITKIPKLNKLVIGKKSFISSSEVRGKRICDLHDMPEIEDITIEDQCFKYYEILKLSKMDKLKNISLGEGCFRDASILELVDLPNLETITISNNCFQSKSQNLDNSRCYIVGCPKLHSLEINSNSFHQCKSFELKNVDSLKTLIIGRDCFAYSDFSLNSR